MVGVSLEEGSAGPGELRGWAGRRGQGLDACSSLLGARRRPTTLGSTCPWLRLLLHCRSSLRGPRAEPLPGTQPLLPKAGRGWPPPGPWDLPVHEDP